MTEEHFGHRLRSLFAGLKNKEIADKLGVSPPAVQNYLKGRVPDAELLLKIANLTGCDLHWLLTGVDSRTVNVTPSATGYINEDFLEQKIRQIVRDELNLIPVVQELGSIDEFDVDAAMERHPHEVMSVIEEWVAHEGWELPKDFSGMLANTGYSEMTEERRKAMIMDWKMILDRDRAKANKK